MRTKRQTMFKSPTLAIRQLLGRFRRDETGASAIEYAIIASGVSVVIVGAVAGLGTAVKGLYSDVAAALK
jgi:pilus assembly protein Flp/PilA